MDIKLMQSRGCVKRVALVSGAAFFAILNIVFASSCALFEYDDFDLTTDEGIEFMYVRKCGTCHAAAAPDEYAADDWPFILDEFEARANLSAAQREILEPWLIERASQP